DKSALFTAVVCSVLEEHGGALKAAARRTGRSRDRLVASLAYLIGARCSAPRLLRDGGVALTVDQNSQARSAFFRHFFAPLQQILGRVRVGQPEGPLAHGAERGARKRGDAGLIQHTVRDRRGIAETETGDVREHVERAVWQPAGDALDAVESRDDRIATPAEFGEHQVDLRGAL